MAEIPTYVLDTFAILAYLQDEPAAPRIEELLVLAKKVKCYLVLSLINLGEILYIAERQGGTPKAHDILRFISSLPIQIIPADEQMVFAAAHIKANHPLSYADAFAAAAAQNLNGILLTGDPEFKALEEFIEVEWLEI
jgi:predicted nucleic acid-binding protein